ncbi:hypothetical protein [Clostridium botulinum]|uniref:hypothetical protein n=1 Tax=Clostridium botulinum TaxID=1491 RepID=UPI00174DCEB0|nr:hypothetical protein [Clostridium botulinum]MBD5589344.1 hypothetical protein [Clostridium botulinum]MBY6842883.1 hypothetical protein [Clostridium botulinum]
MGRFCEVYSHNAEKETEYLIYTEKETIECADIDDMTDFANTLLNNGCKEIRLVISD